MISLRMTLFGLLGLMCGGLIAESPVSAAKVNVAEDFGFNPADSTAHLQAAIDSGARRVIVPNVGQDWVLRPVRLSSDQEIVFEDGVIVVAKPGAYTSAQAKLFTGSGVSNVKLLGYGAIWRMNKSEYIRGEHRHALALYSAQHVEIKGLRIEGSGGDGIYLGNARQDRLPPYCGDILIEDVTVYDHRRQGISVITARNLTIRNVTATATHGAAPAAGIDFEPNRAGERLENIVVDGFHAEGNDGNAVHLFLKHLDDSGPPVTITISNVTARSSGRSGFWITPPEKSAPGSQITIKDSAIMNCGGAGIQLANVDRDDPMRIRFENIRMEQTNQGYPESTPLRLTFAGGDIDEPAPIVFQVRRSYRGSPRVGGVELVNIDIVDVGDRSYFTFQDATAATTLEGMTGTVNLFNPYGYTEPSTPVAITTTWR